MNNIDTSKYDAVLVCNVDDMLNEAFGDERSYTGAGYGKTTGNVPYLFLPLTSVYHPKSFHCLAISF